MSVETPAKDFLTAKNQAPPPGRCPSPLKSFKLNVLID